MSELSTPHQRVKYVIEKVNELLQAEGTRFSNEVAMLPKPTTKDGKYYGWCVNVNPKWIDSSRGTVMKTMLVMDPETGVMEIHGDPTPILVTPTGPLADAEGTTELLAVLRREWERSWDLG